MIRAVNYKKKGLFSRFKSLMALDARPLHSQFLFNIVIFLSLAVIFSVGFYSFSAYDLDLSPYGVRSFLVLSRDLIPYLGLSIAIVALIARIHATVQAHERNLMDRESKIFNHYLQHRKYVKESLEGFDHLVINKEAIDESKVYRNLFPDNGPGHFRPVAACCRNRDGILNRLERRLIYSFKLALLDEKKEGIEQWAFSADYLCTTMATTIRELGISPSIDLASLLEGAVNQDTDWNQSFQRDRLINLIDSYRKFLGDLRYLSNTGPGEDLSLPVLMLRTIRNHDWLVRRTFWEDQYPGWLEEPVDTPECRE